MLANSQNRFIIYKSFFVFRLINDSILIFYGPLVKR